jgi:hypothetical protein
MLIASAVQLEVAADCPACRRCAPIAHHRVNRWSSVSHLGTSGDALLDTQAELHRHNVRLVIRDQPDDRATVETGGLLAAGA